MVTPAPEQTAQRSDGRPQSPSDAGVIAASESTTRSASAKRRALHPGIGHRDDLHAGRVRGGDTRGRVLDDETAARIGAELGRREQEDVGRGLAARDARIVPEHIALKTHGTTRGGGSS